MNRLSLVNGEVPTIHPEKPLIEVRAWQSAVGLEVEVKLGTDDPKAALILAQALASDLSRRALAQAQGLLR